MEDKTKTALIVDDSKTACIVLSRILKKYQVDAEFAYSAAAALELLQEHKPDIIFMDHTMPDMDGLETVKMLKSNPNTATIPVMMFTARGGDVYVSQARALGAIDVLPKSLEVSDVEKALIKVGIVDDASKSDKVFTDSVTVEPKPSTESTVEQRLRMWLESVLENRIVPSIARHVDSTAKNLQQTNALQGDKLFQETIRLQNEIGEQTTKSLKAQGESMRASLGEIDRKINRIVWMMFILLILAVGGLVYANYFLQHRINVSVEHSKQLVQLRQQINDLTVIAPPNLSVESPAVGAAEESPQVTETPGNLQQSIVTDPQGDYIGTLLGIADNGSRLNVLTRTGYMFQIDSQGTLVELKMDWFFSAQGCQGQAFVEALPGIVTRTQDNQIWYTVNRGQETVVTPLSTRVISGECVAYSGQLRTLYSLLPNEPDVTGVTTYEYQYTVGTQQNQNLK